MNKENEVMSLAELEQVKKDLGTQPQAHQITMVKPKIQVPTTTDIDPSHKHTNGLIAFGAICFIVMVVYCIYEIKALIKIGKLAEKELKKHFK